MKILKEKNQVISKRDTHLGNLGRGGRYTKFEENRTSSECDVGRELDPSLRALADVLADVLADESDTDGEQNEEGYSEQLSDRRKKYSMNFLFSIVFFSSLTFSKSSWGGK
jgi:hypothetical protein